MSFSSDFVAYRLSSTSRSHQILFIRVLEHILRMKNRVLKVSHTKKHYYICIVSGHFANENINVRNLRNIADLKNQIIMYFYISRTLNLTSFLLWTFANSVNCFHSAIYNININEIKLLWHPFKYTIVVVFTLRNCVNPTNNCI